MTDRRSTGALHLASPRELAAREEERAALPVGAGDRFDGWGVLGLTFRSGHVLAMRRHPASSLGPGYTAVWHRDPRGAWSIHADVEPGLGCARFFGGGTVATYRDEITIAWTGAHDFTVTMEMLGLDWAVRLAATPATRALNGIGGVMPRPIWRSARILALAGPLAGAALGVGRLALAGRAPRGHRFRCAPRRVWSVDASTALLCGDDLGAPAPLRQQARLGDFWLPQRGLFVVGSTRFDEPDRGTRIAEAAD
jgi:hypothetical protein